MTGCKRHLDTGLPALLVSYYYLTNFLKHRAAWSYRAWVMDSGAFSAHNSGAEINLAHYLDTCRQLRDEDPTLTEIYALDVIGDWRASLRNTKRMWKAGIEAIPCYHFGEPEDVLTGLARDYPKIALGGVAAAGEGQKLLWVEQCFARVWPAKIHGFACSGKRMLKAVPWHSTDASTWDLQPAAFGKWQSVGAASIRGQHKNPLYRAEVAAHLRFEREIRAYWRREWGGEAPTIHLSVAALNESAYAPGGRYAHAFGNVAPSTPENNDARTT